MITNPHQVKLREAVKSIKCLLTGIRLGRLDDETQKEMKELYILMLRLFK